MGPVGTGVVVVGGGGGVDVLVVGGGFGSGVIEVLVDGRADDEEEFPGGLPEVGIPEVGIPKDEIVRNIAETSVGHRANGYVVPETTVPAAARSLR